MTGIELMALLSSSVSMAQILSKFFLPPEAIDPDIKMEYFAEQGYLQYDAQFTIPKPRKLFFRKRKTANVQLHCTQGFLNINARLETETDSRELLVPTLHCSLPPLAGKKQTRPLVGRRVFMTIQISIDLNHRIRCEWFPLEYNGNHLKATVTNTMDIQVKGFQARTRLPTRRKFKKASLIRDGTPEAIPVILRHNTEIRSNSGDLESEFPDADTSNTSWIGIEGVDESSEIIVPIDHLEGRKGVIVDLLFE